MVFKRKNDYYCYNHGWRMQLLLRMIHLKILKQPLILTSNLMNRKTIKGTKLVFRKLSALYSPLHEKHLLKDTYLLYTHSGK